MIQIITIFFIFLSLQIFPQSSDYENAILACRSKIKSIDFKENLKKFNQCFIGNKAPNFIAKTTDGKTIELDNLKGNVVVINFWFIACRPCVAEIPGLNDIAEKYKTDKIQFIGITRDSKVDLDKFYKTKVKFNFKTIPNNENIYNNIFMLQNGFPTTILIDKEGIIRLVTSGGIIDKNAGDEIKSKLIPYIEKYLVE
jgi:peroxiredoxin